MQLCKQFLKEELIMAFVINDSCISCGSCAGGCPVGAIAEGDGKFEIDENTCISCGACAGACPVGAIEEN
jgi:ferredoxin